MLYEVITEFKNGSLYLDSIHPTSSLEEVAANTGFQLQYDEIRYTPLPTEREISMLRLV